VTNELYIRTTLALALVGSGLEAGTTGLRTGAEVIGAEGGAATDSGASVGEESGGHKIGVGIVGLKVEAIVGANVGVITIGASEIEGGPTRSE
jgi:hypothetical protein